MVITRTHMNDETNDSADGKDGIKRKRVGYCLKDISGDSSLPGRSPLY